MRRRARKSERNGEERERKLDKCRKIVNTPSYKIIRKSRKSMI